MNMFERASRLKLRFSTTIGELTTEQLWDLPLTARGDRPDLDKIARAVHSELKGMEEVSFVDISPDPRRGDLELKLEILKHVIAAKKAAAESVERAQANAQRREKLLAALAQKDDEALKGLSREELQAEIEKLSAA